jgi:guanylate kinase
MSSEGRAEIAIPDARLLVVSGASGSGKSTVVKHVAEDARVRPFVSVSATTRPARTGETHGREYLFLSREEFENLIHDGQLLEWAEVHGNLYGTPAGPVLDQVNDGRLAILEIDVQGARQVKARVPNALFAFIHAPSMEELESRLRGRGTDDEAVVRKRLANAVEEIGQAGWYDLQIVNDRLENTVDELVARWSERISGGA